MGCLCIKTKTHKKEPGEAYRTNDVHQLHVATRPNAPSPRPCLHNYPWLMDRRSSSAGIRSRVQEPVLNEAKHIKVKFADETEAIEETRDKREQNSATKTTEKSKRCTRCGKQIKGCRRRKTKVNKGCNKVQKRYRKQNHSMAIPDACLMFMLVWFTLDTIVA